MIQRMKKSIRRRLLEDVAEMNPLVYLRKLDIDDYFPTVISTVYLYTRAKKGSKKTVYMAEVVSAIGHAVRNRYKLKKDSALAAKTGAFLLYTFEAFGMIEVLMGSASNGHGSYIVKVKDSHLLFLLWNNLPSGTITKLPSETPFAPWTCSRHPTGQLLVKTANKDVLEMLTPETHPMIYDVINRKQKVGWTINPDVLEIQSWALRCQAEAFSDIWNLQNPEARTTKLRESKAVGDIARRFLGKTFYHLYYFDFRGRIYPTTAYLHETGSDLARGLLLRADKKRIGEEGFLWLCISIASNWGGDAGRTDKAKTDKIPLEDRFKWVMENEDLFLSYAADPKHSTGWMTADKPWQFLAACFELRKLRLWQQTLFEAGLPDPFDNYDYESHLVVFIDGSNNGHQHLAALTRDEVTAIYVNLVPAYLPGDLYSMVAELVWRELQKQYDTFVDFEKESCEEYIDLVMELKKNIASAADITTREQLIQELRSKKNLYAFIADKASVAYWLRLKDPKVRRKVVKRNVMTIPYGGTSYGLSQQQIDDAPKHGVDQLYYMEHKWGAFLGRLVHDVCQTALKRPMGLLRIFERAGKLAEDRGMFLSWTVPITRFPVVQNYTEGQSSAIYVQYGPPKGPPIKYERSNSHYYENSLLLEISFVEHTVPSKRKQAQGASPNAIHSLDAAHLVMTCYQAPFEVTTVHDSYGALLADMPELYKLVRKTFVELYATDPLTSLLLDINGDISAVELGNLDITSVLDSEYCFA